MGEKVVVFQRLGTSIDARLAAFAQMPVGHALIRMIKTLYVGGSYLVAFAIVVLIGGLTGFFVGIVIDLIAGTKHVNMWWPAGGAIAFGVSSCTGASWHAFKEWRTGRRYAREPAEYRRGAGSRH